MAFALVGTAGAAVTSSSGGNITTLAFGTGESRTAGNLLLCYVTGTGTATAAGAPTGGWTRMGTEATGTSCSATIFYKIAAGSDSAPTITGVASTIFTAHLEEWSGNDPSLGSVLDTSTPNSATGTTSPVTCTLGAADAQAGQLTVMAGADRRSVARASNDTWTSNHGTPTLQVSNNGVSSTDHYSHATLVTNSNSGADTAIMTLSITTSITGLAVNAGSFKLAPVASVVPGGPNRTLLQIVPQ